MPEKVSDMNPKIDAREVVQRAEGMPAGSSMLRKFRMRARTDRKDSSRSMSKATRVPEWSSSVSPERGGTDDHQDPRVTGPHERRTADGSPKDQCEASGHPQKQARTRWRYLQSRRAPSSGRRRLNSNSLRRLRGRARGSPPPPQAGKKRELRTGRSPQVKHTRTRGTTAGRATTMSTLARGLLRT